MPGWNDGLAGVHADIARSASRSIRVLAGPGTGKTFAMVRRVARLLQEGVDPSRILAVTFTRTAAKDLREQLERLGVPGADRVRSATLHSLCFSILSREEIFEATGRVARPLLAYERDMMVADLAPLFGGKRIVKRLIKAYETAWARLQSDIPGPPISAQDHAFEPALKEWLRFHRSMMIGELVPLALDFVRRNPEIPVLPELSEVLADEFQDLNRADQTLVEMLASNGALVVIGDDDQSIYRFRHANPDGIRVFSTAHPGTEDFSISTCRRCPANLVAMANSLIVHDAGRPPRPALETDAGLPRAEIAVVQHPNLSVEADALAEYADGYLTARPNLAPGQVLVLATRRIVGNAIRDALIARGRNAMSYFVEDQLDSAAAAEGFCLLQLIVDPEDRSALRAWLGLGSMDGRARSYQRIRAICEAEARSPASIIREIRDGGRSVPYTGQLVERWEMLQAKLSELRPLSGLDLARRLWSADDDDSRDVRLLAENLAADDPDATTLLERLRLEITQRELPGSDGDVIRVMSLHKSKGLTAKAVIVAGCVAGALPSIDPDDPPEEQDAQIAEQRRLLYVAITRASDALILSSSAEMSLRDAMKAGVTVRRTFLRGGQRVAVTVASPFISELGSEAGPTITTKEWRQRRGL